MHPRWSRLAHFAAIAVALAQPACEGVSAHVHDIEIPRQDHWTDCGLVLREGQPGDWDRFLWGGFALAVTKRSDTYYLYYQGSRYYDDGAATVAGRSIGVATSKDGVHFTKYAGNPVVTWSPSENLEEGAVSTAIVLDESNRIAIYYGANTWAGGNLVSADVRLAVSEDGLNFADAGIVLAHSDRSVWGSGDELFPLIAIRSGSQRIVYYVPNGSRQQGLLGVAWGDGGRLSETAAVLDETGGVAVWGPGGAARIGPGTYALVLSNGRGGPGRSVHVRTMSVARPTQVSRPVVVYDWADVSDGTVLLDEDRDRWLFYYSNAAHTAFGVMVAPVERTEEQRVMAPPCCPGAASSPEECA